MIKVKPVFKFWLETGEGYVFGEGPAELLHHIQQLHTLSGAAKALGMSYRYAWGILREIEERMGKHVVKTYKGGKSGGGGAELTEDGVALLEKYFTIREAIPKISDWLATGEVEFWRDLGSEVEGEVLSIDWEGKSATVKVKIDAPQIVKVHVKGKPLEGKDINVRSRVRVEVRGVNLTEGGTP